MTISVVICTHNGASRLPMVLQSLKEQTLGEPEWEAIVVDNRSTDATADVVHSWQAQMPNLVYAAEERLGLCEARNRGIALARGDYVAYLDDDARAGTNWLASLVHAFQTVAPPPACVGGRVWLDWDGPPPAWLPQRYWSVYSYVNHGDQPCLLGSQDYLVGTNMAFSRKTLATIGGFAVHLDRRGRNLLSGGDTEMVQRYLRSGMPVYYEPQAEVWHLVLPERRCKRWLVRRMYWAGVSQPLLDLQSQPWESVVSARRLLYDLKGALFLLAGAFRYPGRSRCVELLECLCGASLKWGRAVSEWKLLHSPRAERSDVAT